MKTARVRYQDGEYDLRIDVQEARVIDGYKRQVLLSSLLGETPSINPDTPVTDVAIYILKAFTYPNVVSGTKKISNLSKAKTKLNESAERITFEQFLELPEKLIRMWEDAVIELNPHWVPKANVDSAPDDDDEDESPEVREEKKDEGGVKSM